MDVSENSGTRKSSNLIGFSNINHPFWGTPIFGNTHIFLLNIFFLSFSLHHLDMDGRQNSKGNVLDSVVGVGFLRFRYGVWL